MLIRSVRGLKTSKLLIILSSSLKSKYNTQIVCLVERDFQYHFLLMLAFRYELPEILYLERCSYCLSVLKAETVWSTRFSPGQRGKKKHFLNKPCMIEDSTRRTFLFQPLLVPTTLLVYQQQLASKADTNMRRRSSFLYN